ncbi:GNAT family N-acetyltransferase [Agromyces sp. MMS24-JH15]|uniref:GNAT family N-acetyltransferase n=1 Tax=Agromyces sp. MMS24-JH15 TaxID=3243765 RepID=UPI003748F3CC
MADDTAQPDAPERREPPITPPPGVRFPDGVALRRPRDDDHATAQAVLLDWWGGMTRAPLPALLPRLFFQHFSDTSLWATDASGLAGFLVGFRSSAQPGVAYIHFVGVRPDLRAAGLGRALYETFFDEARAAGCRRVDAITGPVNARSQAFHLALGFAIAGDVEIDGVLARADYDGPGEHRVTFSRTL